MSIFTMESELKDILYLLPKTDCGACGAPGGCLEFAEYLANGEKKPEECLVGGEKFKNEFLKLFEDDVTYPEDRMIAVPLCQGGKEECGDKYKYYGVRDCSAAMLLWGGMRNCEYGCLGLGTCVEMCETGAISIDENNLPKIDEEYCNGCGDCVKICPKGIFRMIPKGQKVYFSCLHQGIGEEVTEICDRGCDACQICAGVCPDKAISFEKNIPIIDFDACRSCGICVVKCPYKSFVDRVAVRPTAFIGTACDGCGDCIRVCPTEAIIGEKRKQHKIDRVKCIGCGLCFEICPLKAITIFGALGHLEKIL